MTTRVPDSEFSPESHPEGSSTFLRGQAATNAALVWQPQEGPQVCCFGGVRGTEGVASLPP